MNEHLRFEGLGYEAFRLRAADPSLSRHEKVGFPDSYREGREEAIFADVLRKIPALQEANKSVVEIGPGCAGLPVALIALCEAKGHVVTMIDAPEMLALLPSSPALRRVPGRFPDDCAEILAGLAGTVDAVVAYSVVQYAFAEGNVWRFLDCALSLLAPGGRLLCADIPNRSMRNRFLASEAGHRYHREYSGRDEAPSVGFGRPAPGEMDDAVVLGMLMRAREAGFHGYVLPQDGALPMASRREDLLFVRP